jgi:hypothetical protein
LSLPPNNTKWIMKRINGSAAPADMLKTFDGNVESVKHGSRSASPRNKAVHQGVAPTDDEVADSLAAAHKILKTYSPLPGWE